MKVLGITLLNCFFLIISLFIHRLIIRLLNLPIDNVVVYWGALIAIFGLISLIFALILMPKR